MSFDSKFIITYDFHITDLTVCVVNDFARQNNEFIVGHANFFWVPTLKPFFKHGSKVNECNSDNGSSSKRTDSKKMRKKQEQKRLFPKEADTMDSGGVIFGMNSDLIMYMCVHFCTLLNNCCPYIIPLFINI